MRRLEHEDTWKFPPTRPVRVDLGDTADKRFAVGSRTIGAMIPQDGYEAIHGNAAHTIMIGV
jgi:hypothetical protein